MQKPRFSFNKKKGSSSYKQLKHIEIVLLLKDSKYHISLEHIWPLNAYTLQHAVSSVHFMLIMLNDKKSAQRTIWDDSTKDNVGQLPF